jgi:hypothetical protein
MDITETRIKQALTKFKEQIVLSETSSSQQISSITNNTQIDATFSSKYVFKSFRERVRGETKNRTRFSFSLEAHGIIQNI